MNALELFDWVESKLFNRPEPEKAPQLITKGSQLSGHDFDLRIGKCSACGSHASYLPGGPDNWEKAGFEGFIHGHYKCPVPKETP